MIEPNFVTHPRQFFTRGGKEIFIAEAYGRRPDVRDALRVLGIGDTRGDAVRNARRQFDCAYRALQSAPQVADQ